jgi:hypothetical protein
MENLWQTGYMKKRKLQFPSDFFQMRNDPSAIGEHPYLIPETNRKEKFHW